jgi:hypothetical protein
MQCGRRGFVKPGDARRSNQSKGENPMIFQEETHGNASDIPREVNLISLAANLDDPRFHAIFERSGKLSIIVEKLKSINATRIQQRRSSLDWRHYVE